MARLTDVAADRRTVKTGMRLIPGSTPPVWVRILPRGRNQYLILNPMQGFRFMVSATSDPECIVKVGAELRRRLAASKANSTA